MHIYSATELRDRFAKKKASAVEIVTYFLQRIHSCDPELKSFLTIYEERALAKAKELDQKREKKKPLGKLAGIPLIIKDNIHVHGEITTCGSKILKNYRAPFDATVIRLIEEEDGIILGKGL